MLSSGRPGALQITFAVCCQLFPCFFLITQAALLDRGLKKGNWTCFGAQKLCFCFDLQPHLILGTTTMAPTTLVTFLVYVNRSFLRDKLIVIAAELHPLLDLFTCTVLGTIFRVPTLCNGIPVPAPSTGQVVIAFPTSSVMATRQGTMCRDKEDSKWVGRTGTMYAPWLLVRMKL